MKTNNFVNKAFVTMPLILIGALGISNSANAAKLATGKINLSWDAGVFFQNNVIDFVNLPGVSSVFGGPANPGVSNSDPEFGTVNQAKGNFRVVFADGGFASAGFGNTRGSTTDLFLPPAILGITGGRIINDFEYNLAAIGATSPQLLLEFDRNANGIPDAKYSFKSFLRTVTPDPLGGFNSQISFRGFFESITDGTAIPFDKTDSVISLINGATSINPNGLPVTTFPNLFASSDPDFTGLDGTLTVDTPNVGQIPEGSNTFGLLVFFSMIGLGGFVKKQLNK